MGTEQRYPGQQSIVMILTQVSPVVPHCIRILPASNKEVSLLRVVFGSGIFGWRISSSTATTSRCNGAAVTNDRLEARARRYENWIFMLMVMAMAMAMVCFCELYLEKVHREQKQV